MNFTIVSNISKNLVRNLNVSKLCQNPAVQKLYKINVSSVPKAAADKIKKQQLDCQNKTGNNQRDGHNENKENHNQIPLDYTTVGVVSYAFLFNIFGTTEVTEETPEEKLVNTIKRSILCMQREEWEKAEQMLHLALRMAQDTQNQQGITYVYDVMANLAMEREQFQKAEKLFADVMKRLFADGHAEDSAPIMHISSKLAHMAQLQGDLEKSRQGFTWTLKKLESYLRKSPNDVEVQELMGLTKNWFGQLLMKQGKYAEAKKLFQEAYNCLVGIYGTTNEESITILNNLSVASLNLDDFNSAKAYLFKAIELVAELKDSPQEGILHANLGLLYLREGLVKEAQESCTTAWRIGRKGNHSDAIEQSEYCLNEIKLNMSQSQ